MNRRHSNINSFYQSGFTLLEMVLVLFLLGLMASTTLMLSEGVEDQAKYDETKRRMEIIRKAIVGDPTRTVNGSPEISGFVADMGRLPRCVSELLTLGNAKIPNTDPKTYESPCDDTITITAWNIDTKTGLGSGWRGPYIQVLPERNGDLRFRDGYLNTGTDASGVTGSNLDASNVLDDERYSGWTWRLYKSDNTETTDITNAVSVRLQSYGLDGSNKYPTGSIDTVNKLVVEKDYRVELANWDNFQVEFKNVSAGVIQVPANTLRVKMSYADNGTVNPWPANQTDRNNSDYLSGTFPSLDIYISNGNYNVTSGQTVIVPLSSGRNVNELTIGTTGVVTFPDSTKISVNANDVLTIPEGSTLSGTDLTINQNGKIFFPPYRITTGLQNSDNISPVTGQYSLIVACDDTSNESSVSGQRFDGLCTRYGDDATPQDYSPLSRTYLFDVPAKSQQIQPPSPLVWTIQ